MQLVDRDSQLLPRAVQLRFRDAHQLLVGQRVVEGLLRLKRHLILLIGVPGVRGGYGGRGVPVALNPAQSVEQVEAERQARAVLVAAGLRGQPVHNRPRVLPEGARVHRDRRDERADRS